MSTKSIHVIEDDPDLSELLNMHLGDEGYNVTVSNDGKKGLDTSLENQFDLIILDLMLPTLDGLSVCRELRNQPDYVPILMLTAKSSEIDRVLGLEMGADDYLTKPFSIRELIARVKAIFRRSEAMNSFTGNDNQQKTIQVGDLFIDPERRQVSIKGQSIELTAKEYDLLVYFAQHPGRVYSRVQLLDEVWGYGHDGYEHTVNTHINRLRSKIEDDPANPHYILTVWGVGYKFTEQA
jgi:DNA-binding response OmpR family regulator